MVFSPAAGDPSLTQSFAVLLATFNGAEHLDEQLASIADQTVDRIDIMASDDGSSDSTPEVLLRWRTRWTKGTFTILHGPRRGFAENFRFLAQRQELDAQFVAFSDQDDVWDPDKLARAADAIIATGPGPVAYFGRTRLVDGKGRLLGLSPLFRHEPSFKNAVVQSIGGGNTMVHNAPAFRLFVESCQRTSFVTHDWWAYMLCTGAGGIVRYDPVPHISYRQHDRNLVGGNVGVRARLTRFRQLIQGRFSHWTDQNLAALNRCWDMLTPEAHAIVDLVREIRAEPGLRAAYKLGRSGLYRQTALGNIGLGVAATLGRL